MAWFLVQITAMPGYADITGNRRYVNSMWMGKRRDKDQRQVNPGDQLLVYCTGNIPEHGRSLAFMVTVNAVSADQATFKLDAPRWFPSPLTSAELRALVADGAISPIFKNCGQQRFNIVKLDPVDAQQILERVNH